MNLDLLRLAAILCLTLPVNAFVNHHGRMYSKSAPATVTRRPSFSSLRMEASPARDPIGVGVIGAGRIGIVHLEALASCANARPVIISNPTVSKAKAAAEKFNVPEFTGSDSDVINHPDVEAVWICSPSNFHADQIKACAAAGKHV